MANKFVFHAQPGVRIPLGKQGEKNHLEVHFNISKWRQTFGDGVVDLIARRCGEAEAYPVTDIVSELDTVIWTVIDVDTANPGFGSAELQYYVGDTLVKSATYTTVVADSLDPTGDPPDPYESWLQQLIAAGFGNLPDGGTEGQALVKLSNEDRDVGWKTVKGGGDITTDPTLTIEGQAADAKAVGDKLEKLSTEKLDADKLPTAVNDALAQAKASGEFDGADGKDGEDGEDGYTPIKGTDYFTDADKAELIDELAENAIPVPAAAEVGQTIVVSAVDENGKPTAWDVAAASGGGGGKGWRHIAHLVTTEAVSEILIDTDMDGNAFNLREVAVDAWFVANADNPTADTTLWVYFSDHANSRRAIATLSKNSTTSKSFKAYGVVGNDGLFCVVTGNGMVGLNVNPYYEETHSMSYVDFLSKTEGNTFAAGTIISVWGVDA